MVNPEPTRVRILHFIESFTARHGYQPTVREIGGALNLKSTSTVYGHLQRLQRDGFLILSPFKPRSMVLASNSPKKDTPTRRFLVEHDDGTTAYLEFPNANGMPEDFGISHYKDERGDHIVTKCTECI